MCVCVCVCAGPLPPLSSPPSPPSPPSLLSFPLLISPSPIPREIFAFTSGTGASSCAETLEKVCHSVADLTGEALEEALVAVLAPSRNTSILVFPCWRAVLKH